MDYNFKCSTVRLDPRVRLSRNIALIDMLRTMPRNVPDDAVLLYLHNNDMSGLGDLIFGQISLWHQRRENSSATADIPRKIEIPEELRTMAGEFLFSVIIEEIYNLRENGCWRTMSSATATTPVYPLAVRNALTTAYFANGASVHDHREVIDVLRANICNDASITANHGVLPFDERKRFWKKQNFDVLTSAQMSKISAMHGIVSNAIREMCMSRQLLAPYDMSGLLDLMEVLLVLQHTGGYIEASNTFAMHEYAKMTEIGRERARPVWHDDYHVRSMTDERRAMVSPALDFYTRLTPQAVLLMGRNSRLWAIDRTMGNDGANGLELGWWYADALRNYLEKNGQTVQNVTAKIFIKQEVAINVLKIGSINDDIHRHNREFTGGYIRCDDGDCCEDSPCVAG